VSRRALIASLLLALGAIAAPQAPPAAEARWDAKLQALHPTRPSAYFELAEDIADAAASDEERGLARRLFALAGALDPERLGRSACLALADMQSQPHLRRRLLALATLLGERRGEIAALDVLEQTAAPSADAALAVAEAFSHYRRGEGQRATAVLQRAAALDLLAQHDEHLPGGLNRFLEDCRLYRGGRMRPQLSHDELTRMIELEAALLAGERRTWSEDLLLGGARPLIEIDPDRLAETLEADLERPLYRGGRWIAAP
jgi:hypothetical protein